MILYSFERNTIRAFLDVSGREKLGFPWHGRQPVRPQLMLETFGLPDRADLPHVLLSARESWIDEGMGARCSAACPFDSDLPTVVLEILSRGKMADLIPEDREKLFERQNEFFIVGLGMSVPFLQNQYAFVFPSLMECSRPYSEPAAFDFQSCNTTNKTDDPHGYARRRGARGCCTISMIPRVIGFR